jgi:uncharacterized hydantoinase/oxoprolinase family protein
MAAAHAIRDRQAECLAEAVLQVSTRLGRPPSQVILSGVGEFLGRSVVERLKMAATVISLRDKLGAAISRCAPAHALAVLAREEFDR